MFWRVYSREDAYKSLDLDCIVSLRGYVSSRSRHIALHVKLISQRTMRETCWIKKLSTQMSDANPEA
jgi:hypothetical protein